MLTKYSVAFTRDTFSETPGPLRGTYYVEAQSADDALVRFWENACRSSYKGVTVETVTIHVNGVW